jgi:putative Mn2+ efflux pump MntP
MNASQFLSWIPGWLGFLLLILVGVAMLINGIANPDLDHVNRVGFIVFGICALLVGAFSWIAGATSKIKGREGKVGVRVGVGDMPWWAWIVDVAIVVISVVIFIALK